MPKTKLNQFLASLLLFFIALLIFSYKSPDFALSATATHLVISEVQLAADDTSADFIELYNPTALDINLGNLRLIKRNSSSSTNESIVAFNADEIIPAHGYYLWCNTSLSATLGCNRNTGETITNNNSVALATDPLDTGTVIDAVTFGSPANPLGEGTFLAAPEASTSVERKALSTSDATSMGIGGIDELLGNGEDTGNNTADFVLRTTPQPQTVSSPVEPTLTLPSPTPTENPSPTPTTSPEPSVTATPSPTLVPSATPDPTPTPLPSSSPSVTPSASPQVSPSASPLASPTASPSATPSVSPTPSPANDNIIFSGTLFTCRMTTRTIHTRFFTFTLPRISCSRNG